MFILGEARLKLDGFALPWAEAAGDEAWRALDIWGHRSMSHGKNSRFGVHSDYIYRILIKGLTRLPLRSFDHGSY